MPLRGIVREQSEIREGSENSSRKVREGVQMRHLGKSHIVPEQPSSSSFPVPIDQSRWASLPPELLLDIIQRVEASETSWPSRRDVVACASVCRSWRMITKEVVRTPEQCGWITFPISLKQPGPRDTPIQCFIKRERATSTFRLYLGLSPALSGNLSKLLLTAKRFRRAMSTEFIVSLVPDDFSRASNNYIGKLRSNFLGTKFSIYDSQPPHDPKLRTSRSKRRIHLKQVSPSKTPTNYTVAAVAYELNVLRTRGPRRMRCTMHSIPVAAVEEGGTAPTPTEFKDCINEHHSSTSICEGKKPIIESPKPQESMSPLVLKNKAPRWHEQLQCWCLNFKGRVTVASVKNFQLVAAVETSENVSAAEQERVILQFGKIGKDIFTMDYRYPLSAFHAFAICLSSFDTKPACE
ncbi:tubby-like F-box protein 5 [Cucurbita pepo subsp. pepo]|uniref:tubby-like F-box protein 5 n=1 Tax=Cucurbita pepo subsp. pepo TaxID=3664 RepID=UPI000C9D522E|nr:tubby-like F-box protein 5 [Cucurbita pepo subsp. pepo]